MNKNPYTIEFEKVGDPSIGFISVAENQKVPFPIVRLHWTYLSPDKATRGNHAHKELEQVLIAVAGQITVETETANLAHMFMLDHPNKGLYVPPRCWIRLVFSQDAVLLCLASNNFKEDDYIRDYGIFKKYYSDAT